MVALSIEALVVIGTVGAQFAGAWAYRRVDRSASGDTRRKVLSAIAAGAVTTIVAAPVYMIVGVDSWIGIGTNWEMSAFFGVCMGICQAVLFRGRPGQKSPRPE